MQTKFIRRSFSVGGKSFILKSTICLALIVITTSLCFNFADAQVTSSAGSGNNSGTAASGNVVPSNPSALRNPLGTNDPNELVGRIIKNVLGIVGSLALLMFVVGGLMWMLSAGSEQRVKKGKDILTWASLGLVIIFTSYAILKFVFEVLTKTEA